MSSSPVTEIRRVVALMPVVTNEQLAQLDALGIVVEKKYLDIASYTAMPYIVATKEIRFLQVWVFIQQLLIIYLLYRSH